jgi:hypothetical protein
MSGASLQARERPSGDAHPISSIAGHRRACASLVASCAAGVRELALERMTDLHTAVLIATFVAMRPRVARVRR